MKKESKKSKYKFSSTRVGSAPGSLVYRGKEKKEKINIEVIDYNLKTVKSKKIENIDELKHFNNNKTITWINITGIHDINIIQKIGEIFNLHPLILEDILNTKQRPKVDVYDNNLFIVLKMLQYNDKSHDIDDEQLSLVLGKGYVITFQEKKGDVFDPIRNRINDRRNNFSKGSDYLCYALIDTVVDYYFLLLEKIGEHVENLEDKVLKDASNATLSTIYSLKRELIIIRKSIWPLREIMSILIRDESKLISRETLTYLRDVYDHTVQVIDTVETFRDMLSGMLDLYMSTVSNKMNEVMKVLTVIATIFIPLTFIAGVYGMNFNYMPELQYKYAYFVVWGVMIFIGGLMTYLFKKQQWL